MTGPGTAPSGRPSADACAAVLSEPDRQPASTHDGRPARGGDEPVALEEPPLRRRRAARHLGDRRLPSRRSGSAAPRGRTDRSGRGRRRGTRSSCRDSREPRGARCRRCRRPRPRRSRSHDRRARSTPRPSRARRSRSPPARRRARSSGRGLRATRAVRAPTARAGRAPPGRREPIRPGLVARHDESRAEPRPPAAATASGVRRRDARRPPGDRGLQRPPGRAATPTLGEPLPDRLRVLRVDQHAERPPRPRARRSARPRIRSPGSAMPVQAARANRSPSAARSCSSLVIARTSGATTASAMPRNVMSPPS